jgi:hypothetical protein
VAFEAIFVALVGLKRDKLGPPGDAVKERGVGRCETWESNSVGYTENTISPNDLLNTLGCRRSVEWGLEAGGTRMVGYSCARGGCWSIPLIRWRPEFVFCCGFLQLMHDT